MVHARGSSEAQCVGFKRVDWRRETLHQVTDGLYIAGLSLLLLLVLNLEGSSVSAVSRKPSRQGKKKTVRRATLTVNFTLIYL